jgi:hypothetical protein
MITLTKTQRENADQLRTILDQVIKGNQATTIPVEGGMVMYDVVVVMDALARTVANILDISSTEVRRQQRLNYFEKVLLDTLYASDKKNRPTDST